MIAFTVYGTPAPAGSKRGFYNKKAGRVIVTDDSARSRPWKAQVADAAAETMNGGELLRGPMFLGCEFYFPRPKGHYGKRGLRPSAPAIPTVKPDLLKLARAVEDALSGVVYVDDAQIAREILDKFYGEPARVEVRLWTLEPGRNAETLKSQRAEAEGRRGAA
jgi:Holliday junction resolvase RusA-like endonuclease